jgi:hypothetical protein
MVADELTNIETAVERTEAAVIEEATAIARLRREVALIIEALEKLDRAKFQGLENHLQGEAARARYREIVEQLKPATRPKSSSTVRENRPRAPESQHRVSGCKLRVLIGLLIAFGPAYHSGPNGSRSLLRSTPCLSARDRIS